ncbi:hypothetical protein ABBQ38_008078 [Trebouxia sp. C0009 RCD-2024]
MPRMTISAFQQCHVLPEADARVQHSLQEALSCPLRDPVICLLLARLKPCIPRSDSFQRFAHPRKHAVKSVLWHQDLQPLLRMSKPVRLRVNTSKSARAPAASRCGSLCLTKPLYLSQSKLLTFPVRSELQETTGVLLTSGVSASRLGFASIRSSPVTR